MFCFNNFRCMLGQQKKGVQFGGDIILQSLKIKIFNNLNITKHLDYKKGYNLVNKNLKKKLFNINFGGDHSIAVSTIQPMLNYYKKDLLVIWIDAHADINTYNSSTTKNKHGMPLSALTGQMENWYPVKQNNYTLPYNNLIYIGIRDLDSYEEKIINENNIVSFPTCCGKYNKHIINTIQQHPAKYIHISCDIDSMDPSIMPSTGTPVINGLSVTNVCNIIKLCKPRLVSFDLVEFNPFIGSITDVQKTLSNINKIITCLKKCN